MSMEELQVGAGTDVTEASEAGLQMQRNRSPFVHATVNVPAYRRTETFVALVPEQVESLGEAEE